jgi:diguanylate cyclase (GGDEF)-like protein/PAS domain S-box-containing protein
MLAQGGDNGEPDGFLRPLVRYLAQTLGAVFVCVDRLDLRPDHAETLSVFREGRHADNFSYALPGTPCGMSVGRDVQVFASGVQGLFPSHCLLRELRAESYIGVTLWGRNGQPVGLIVAISQQTFGNLDAAQNLLRLLAVRAAAEIERIDVEAQLRVSNQALSVRTTQLELTLDSISQGVSMKDASGRMVFQSRRAMELLELPPHLQQANHADISRFQAERGDFGEQYALVQGLAQDYVRGCGGGEARMPSAYTRSTPGGRSLEIRTLPLPDGAWVRTYADVTDYMQAIADRTASEALWKLAVEGAGDGVWDWDPMRSTGRFSPLYKQLLGFAPDTPDADLPAWEQRLHPDDRPRVLAALQAHYGGQAGVYVSEHRQRCRDGAYRWMLERGMVVRRDADGVAQRLVGTMSDISERKRAEQSLKLAASVFTHTMEGIVITDASGFIVEVNEAFSRITGYSREEAIGQTPRILSSGRQGEDFYDGMWSALQTAGQWSGEIWNRHKNGELYAEILTISAVRNEEGQTLQYVALFTDITAHKEHERQLEHIAHFDALTGLPNRVLLGDRLQQAMLRCNRQNHSLAVAFLDLDGFKAINDAHGHDVGDDFLIAVGQRMKSVLREEDSLARIGGDEFVAVLVDLDAPEACEPVLQRLLQAAAEPVMLRGKSLNVSASIGVTIYPQDGVGADQLMRHADQAMYVAKQAGRNRYHLFDLAHDSAAKSQRESLEQIRHAFAERQFVLHYQPKVHMRTGRVIGAEALIRWEHPQRGLLPPAAFLPTLENHPLSLDVGDWVIATALDQMVRWKAAGLHMPVSVNIGAGQLQQPDFARRLAELLAAHPQIPSHCLELEILETSALEDITQVSEVMQACKALGVRFALDDFGTGYSSLTYLKRLPADMIKIDQSFVRDMLEDTEDRAIVEGVVGLARVFQREVIAEGVETIAHGALLLQLGCELAQGYGIARPMPAQALPQWEASWRAAPAWQQ